jgi:xylulokinase
MKLFIGIDTSTTATKTLLIDENGLVLGVASNEYSYETPQPLWSEQSPHLWWDATKESIRQVLAKTNVDKSAVKGIGLTGQMHGLVLLDENGEVLRPSILWNDQRTAAQCDSIRAKLGREKLIQITGNDALTGFTAPKILWVQDNEPEIWKRTRHVLLPKDYVRYKMTGNFAIDVADGAGTILFDLKNRNWSQEVLSALNIPFEYLPKVYEGTDITGGLLASVADELGLPAGTPVIGGGGDQAASAVGTGAVTAGVASLSLGTSGVVFVTTDTPAIEPQGRLHAFCHSVPNKWHFMGVMLSAAGSLRWYRDTFAPNTDYDKLLEPAADIPPGSDGLLFLPYLTGERTPHPDPLARGAFVGLTVRHTQPHLARSVLEGVSFGLRDSFELIKNAGVAKIKEVRVTGGGARSPLWRQILADVLNVELTTVASEEGAAYGAALLAATGTGIFQNVQIACEKVIRVTGSTKPGPASAIYSEIYPIYRELYPSLSAQFNKIAKLTQTT